MGSTDLIKACLFKFNSTVSKVIICIPIILGHLHVYDIFIPSTPKSSSILERSTLHSTYLCSVSVNLEQVVSVLQRIERNCVHACCACLYMCPLVYLYSVLGRSQSGYKQKRAFYQEKFGIKTKQQSNNQQAKKS